MAILGMMAVTTAPSPLYRARKPSDRTIWAPIRIGPRFKPTFYTIISEYIIEKDILYADKCSGIVEFGLEL
jgi:hypothetical protein